MTTTTSPLIPKRALQAGAALVLLNLVMVGVHQLTTPDTGPPSAAVPDTAPLAERQLRFVSEAGGPTRVYDATTNGLIGTLADTDGFVTVVLSAFAFDRTKRAIAEQPAYRLTRWPDGKLTITDPSTGITINLGAFGLDNKSRFERFVPAPEAAPT